MSVVIRRMRSDDYAQVVDIWIRSGLPYQPRGRDSEERVREQLEKDSSIYLVAEDHGKVVGVVLVTHDLRKGWLNRLAVPPEEQGKGIAKELVSRAEEDLSTLGVNIFAVQVHEHNHRSRKLFAELGYQEHHDIIYCSKRYGPDE
ncbi:MAG TPA: GNAT family N-acetyltransferase [Methanomassiliicoccales archaeon]|nr:GNAT family N-acetyltransferase [Methanomassiliicoccales archaeon]HPR98403.1 GNAT family N-acetyltransferase [Methanomassiliicoccales archaeon]HSA35860.1 GNAT family N-acetyltransferase [Methanomassiliicoccales archaeon]